MTEVFQNARYTNGMLVTIYRTFAAEVIELTEGILGYLTIHRTKNGHLRTRE